VKVGRAHHFPVNHWRCSTIALDLHAIYGRLLTLTCTTPGYNHLFKAKLLVEIVGMGENQMMPSLKHGVHIGLWIMGIMEDG